MSELSLEKDDRIITIKQIINIILESVCIPPDPKQYPYIISQLLSNKLIKQNVPPKLIELINDELIHPNKKDDIIDHTNIWQHIIVLSDEMTEEQGIRIFQELIRILAANQLAKSDKYIQPIVKMMVDMVYGDCNLSHTFDKCFGKSYQINEDQNIICLKQIIRLMNDTIIFDQLPIKFQMFLDMEMKQYSKMPDPRYLVQRCLSYPDFKRSSSKFVDIPAEYINNMRENIVVPRFEFKLIDNIICLVPSITDNMVSNPAIGQTLEIELNEELCKSLQSHIDPYCIANPDPNSVVIVTSDIVDRIGIDNVKEFMEDTKKFPREDDADDGLKVKLGLVKSAVLLDSIRFSECYLVSLVSNDVEYFLHCFNKRFHTMIDPPVYLTFAGIPRKIIMD